MDESGQSGDNRAAGGGGGESRDRTLLNGWTSSGSPWAAATSRDEEAEEDIPAWRRPSQEIRPFTRQPPVVEHPDADIRPFSHPNPSGVRPFGTSPAPISPATTAQPEPAAPHWSDSTRRYEDLRRHFDADSGVEPVAPARFQNLARSDGDPGPPRGLNSLRDARALRDAGLARESGLPRESMPRESQSREEDLRPQPATHLGAPPPNSAPPYPYEGDLDDTAQTIYPAVGPVRRMEPARHALDPTPFAGTPVVQPPADADRTAEPRSRPGYDPGSFPRRLPYEQHAPARFTPANENATAYATPAVYASGVPEQTARGLPQRVPAKPDVPTVPEPPPAEPSAETPALARIATHLRRDDLLAPQDRQEGFDVQAILAAVREVDGVRDAMLRTTPQGANSLRLDLAEGADPAEVSRHVARLLQDRMGLDAAMQGGADSAPPPPPPLAALVPSQAQPSDPIAGAAPPIGQDLRRMPTEPLRAEMRTEQGHFEQSRPEPVRPEPVRPEPVRPEPVREEQQVPEAPSSGPSAGTVSVPETEAARRTEESPRPLDVGEEPGPRVMIDNVQVTTFGTEATVEVKLGVDGRTARGVASGPAVDGYLLRLCATATSEAINDLLAYADRHPDGPARCFVEHAASVPFGGTQVAVVVMLMSVGGAWVEQLSGSAMVGADGRHAMVRATLAAVNRRLEALLSR